MVQDRLPPALVGRSDAESTPRWLNELRRLPTHDISSRYAPPWHHPSGRPGEGESADREARLNHIEQQFRSAYKAVVAWLPEVLWTTWQWHGVTGRGFHAELHELRAAATVEHLPAGCTCQPKERPAGSIACACPCHRGDALWDRYVNLLGGRFRVLASRAELYLRARSPMALAARDVPSASGLADIAPADRVTLAVWTLDHDDIPPGLRGALLPPFRADKHSMPDVARARALSDLVGRKVLSAMLSAAEATGLTLGDVMTHVVQAAEITREHLRLLVLGVASVDAESLLGISRALRLRWDGDWRITDNVVLASEVRRSALIENLQAQLCGLATSSLDHLAVETLHLPSVHEDPAHSPEEFQSLLESTWSESNAGMPPRASSRYYPLYEALVARPENEVTLTFSEIDEILGPPGLPETAVRSPKAARRTGGDAWWAKGGGGGRQRPHVRAWQAAGYVVKTTDHRARSVTFEGLLGRGSWQPHAWSLREKTYTAPVTVVDLSLDDQRAELVRAVISEALRVGIRPPSSGSE
ncbi:hypothetical protein GCM10007967_01490 [Xylanimonas ulmi]